MSYKVISLFSGCGGLDLGFKQEGYEIVWANDNKEYACETYRHNIGDEIVEGDITEIDTEEIPDGDIVLGGFPCQPFSSAGKREGTQDYRGTLFEEVVRVVDAKEPEMFLLENVTGLKSFDDGQTLETILQAMQDLGYKTRWKVLRSDKFGVAQKRKRLFIAGWKGEGEFRFPHPVEERKVLGDILPKIPDNAPNQEVKPLSNQAEKMIDYIPEGGSWKDVPYDILPDRFQKIKDNMKKYKSPNMYRRYSFDEPNGTITAAATPENCGILHPKEDRRYSVREVATIQSFPHDFEFQGSLAQQYEQIGNAVPPKLAEHIARKMKSFLDKSHEEKKKTSIKGWMELGAQN
jgi:DNA (cytosine-5)-methyltransferase 1